MTATGAEIAVPDTTGATLSLLRELRRGQGRKKAASLAYGIYVVALVMFIYGGSVILAAVRALRQPPKPTPVTPHLLSALPAGLTSIALLALLVLLRDALWRGPVTLPPAVVDWLLGTPVDRRRLLRPRFWLSVVLAMVAGIAAGVVVTAGLVEAGLGGRDTADVVRLAGAATGPAVLLAVFATGCGCVVERYEGARRWLWRVTPVLAGAAVVFAGLAVWASFRPVPAAQPFAAQPVVRPTTRPPIALAPIGLPPVALAPVAVAPIAHPPIKVAAIAQPPVGLPPIALALVAVAAIAALTWGWVAAAGVPAARLRVSGRAVSSMSASLRGMDSRGFSRAYRDAAGAGTRTRAGVRFPPPRWRPLVLAWRDGLALARSPSRLAAAILAALLAVGLFGVSQPGQRLPPLVTASGLSLGYLATAWLCEGARQDADDPRRSAQLPYRYSSLPARHAVIPAAVLLVVTGLPVAVACVASASAWPAVMLVVTVPALVAGAMVNVFRGPLPPGAFGGFDTPFGSTGAITIAAWAATGPVLAVVPLTALLSSFTGPAQPAAVIRAVVIGAGLTAVLGSVATSRARRLRSDGAALGRGQEPGQEPD